MEAVTGMGDRYTFRLTVLGRYQTPHEGNEVAVTISVLAGRDDHLVHAGTLTMSQSEWETFAGALKESLGDDVEIDDNSARA